MAEEINGQDHATILAALRWYQHCGMGDPDRRPDWLHEIAVNSDEEISQCSEGIDELCERINGSTLLIEPGTGPTNAEALESRNTETAEPAK